MTRSDPGPRIRPTRAGESSILHLLARRAAEQGDELVYRFRPNAPAPEQRLTYAELDARARRLAGWLEREGLAGERLLLLFPAGLEFVEAFFACLYAGVIAVPAYPPRANRTLERIESMARDAGARAALVAAGQKERALEATRGSSLLSSIRWLAADPSEREGAGAIASPSHPSASALLPIRADLDPDAVAYLQYTSGSTSEPKGVMISHRNVLANLQTIAIGFAHDRESRALTWLPHFHDMGLIDGILQPVYSGFPTTILDPLSFLQNPARWLELITELRITHTGGPNFAYELTARRVEPDREKYDLASWAVAYNGAEPVRADTLERFARTFARCGFDRRALYPAYGLAEATLKVTGGDRGAGPTLLSIHRAALEAGRVDPTSADLELVGSGHVAGDTRIRIVRVTDDEDGNAPSFTALDENEVGEVWVAGPSVARGYWNRPEESRATFQATLPNDETHYLRTGDLGFVRHGELFVTGRAKDLIIIRGRNVYPQDLERTAEACGASIRPGGAAAFRFESDSEAERVALVIEVDRHGPKDPDRLLATIRAAIVEAHEVDPAWLVLVKPGGVPRTSSGKVQRAACRRALEQGALPALAEWRAPSGASSESSAADPNSPRTWLEARLARALDVAQVGIAFDQPLAHFGLDSLRATELAHEIEVTYGLLLEPGELLLAPSLESIALRLEAARPVEATREIEARAIGTPPEECDLSAGQLALWFLQELAPESSAYTIAAALRLRGACDDARLVAALEQVVTRHASLRARIVRRDGQPRQRFDVPFSLMLERGELVDDENLSARLADLALQPFDLERGPLARFGLYRIGDERILLLSIHHLIADLWSLSVLLRDLSLAYDQGGGAKIRVEEMPPHPSEFVSWQRDLLSGAEGEALLAALRQELAGPPPVTSLQTDRRRPAGQTFRGGLRRFDLSPATAAALRDLAKARGVTLYALLLAAFQLLVARLSGESEVWVGAPAAGRTRARFRDLVAYLVNPIVIRGDLSDDPTFLEFLDATAARLARAQRTQDFPFPRLVRERKAPRDPSRSPLFDHMFELRATSELVRGDLAAGSASRMQFADGLWAEALEIDRRTAQFDLSVSATDHGDRLSLEYEWNRDLYEEARVDGWHACFTTLLEAIAREPDSRASRLPLIPKETPSTETHARTVAPRDPARAFHRLVEAHAAATPQALAAVHGDARLTYGELEARATRLAARLRACAVGPEMPVAVSMPKSLDLLVALLAIWKAGGAYVALDPTQPSERRRFLVADAGAHLVLVRRGDARAEGSDAPASIEDLGAPLLAIDDDDDLAPAAPFESITPDPESLAYVVYTSGTTGRPKGVMVSHASYLSAYRAWDRAYDLARFHAHLQMASPSFDVFLGDVARAWGAGRPLVLVDRETLLDPPALAELCREHEVDFGDFLPATLRELAAHLVASGEPLRRFQTAVVGSDAWFTADVPLFRAAFGPRTEILNSYGVTEATIDSCFDRVSDRDLERSVPAIGSALSNSTLYVLDRHLEPVPPGVRGELYIGGVAVARGYLGQPELTAVRFLPDPFGPPGTRMYRSGDQARRLLDGRVEFVGRGDTQVKIRGYRVEPTEIEAVLKQHPQVRDAAVIAHEQGRTRRLIAYVVASAQDAELRAHAAALLPAYMVPSAFVFLPQLPLTANRKLDRAALPAPNVVVDGTESRAARGGAEETLAAVWRELLALEQVGAHDNFFELGGDSILAIQVVSRARERGITVTARALFERPTIAGLAEVAEESQPSLASAAPSSSHELPLLPIQRWFFAQRFEHPEHWNLSIAIEAKRPLEPDTVRATLALLHARHESLRARFLRDAGGWHAHLAELDRELPPLALAETNDTREIDALAARLATELDLAAGPLLRAGLARDPERSCLLLVIHHLVMDGISLRTLLEEFESIYLALDDGRPVELPAPSVNLETWGRALLARELPWAEIRASAARLRARSESIADASAEARSSAGPFEAQVDFGREAETRIKVAVLDRDETARLLRAAAGGLLPLLLAALTEALAETDRPLWLDLEEHGRDLLPNVDSARTIGWFTEFARLALRRGEDPMATLRAIPGALSSAVRPLMAARYAARDPELTAELDRLPRPRISFNYLGRFDPLLESSQLWTGLREPDAPRRSGGAARTHALEIDASIEGGELRVRWSHRASEADATERAATSFHAALRLLVSTLLGEEGDAIEAVLPLTPMQEGMLYHHLESPEHDPYVAQIALELEGSLDLPTFAAAWQDAVDSFPALRTEFVWQGLDRPEARVRREATLPCATLEANDEPLPTRMARLRARPFDLTRAPLARLDLLPRGDDGAVAILTHHHLLFDGWSLPILIERAFEAYESRVERRAPRPLRREPPQAFHQWREARDPRETEQYFARYLAGYDGESAAPAARVVEARGAGGTGTLEAALPQELEAAARRLGITASTLVQAAWALTMATALGESDIIFGATSSGRAPEVPGIEDEVGLFINTLPVRVKLDRTARVIDWMRGLQAEGAELRRHEQASLASVQRAAAARTPLFQTLLVFENYPLDLARVRERSRFRVRHVHLHEETNYPLTLVAGAGLSLRLLYDRTHYDDEAPKRLLARFRLAAERLVAQSNDRLGEISLVTSAEAETLARIGRGPLAPRRDASLVARFRRVVAMDPAAIALEPVASAEFAGAEAASAEAALSYAALDARSRELALALTRRGVARGARVLIALDRSIDLIVAMLGVLRAGAVYVPIDPEWPQLRARAIAEELSVPLVIATRGDWAPFATVTVAALLREGQAALPEVECAPTPDEAAIVLYTSGSTGVPKGIELSHGNVLNLIDGSPEARNGPGEATLHLASIAFDAATLEIWGTLLHGGRLGIPPSAAPSASDLARWIESSRITSLFLTTGLFHLMVEEEPTALARLPRVLTGGDVLSPAHIARYFAAGGRLLVNCYGPTEATTYVARAILTAPLAEGERAPLGCPIANTTLRVLDDAHRPVPIGAPGELWIGGASVARGYAEKPELTASAFLADPLGPAGARLYRTGDRVRWRQDGQLDFLGRRDGQIKVRGFRVELSEVEAALTALPAVRAAAVVVEGERGRAELHAFVVVEEAAGLEGIGRDGAALARALKERVPRYLVPARITFLDALPLTTAGKVDRRALPRGDERRAVHPAQRDALSAPTTTPLEESIAEIWRDVLEVSSVGAEDDFFDLGGHSLHATRVISRIGRVHGVELPIRALFDAPTVRGLARRIESARQSSASAIPIAAEAERRRASFAQARLWFLDRLEPESAAYNIAGAMRLRGPLDQRALEAALAQVVERHEALRSTFHEDAGEPIVRIEAPSQVTIPLDEVAGGEAEALQRAAEFARLPFDLARGPLYRARLFRLEPDDHLLVFALHHIAADGWSIGILIDEWTRAYRARVEGADPKFRPLRAQYADWASWQRARLGGGVGSALSRQLEHWRATLDALPTLQLPTDLPRPARPTSRGAAFAVELGPALTAALEARARDEGVTLHMLLLAAFAALLGRWSGQRDLGIGTPVANRTVPEAEALIGVFINTLVIRARWEDAATTFRQLLGQVRESTLAAYANQDAPFEEVVAAIDPTRDLARTPLFQAMFILQNAPTARFDLGAVRAERVELPALTSNFDLTLSLEVEGDAARTLRGELEYSTELFHEETPRRLFEQWRRFLESVAREPDQAIARVPLLSPAERERALASWSGANALRSSPDSLPERIADQARRWPERVAALLDHRRLSYGELDDRALRLARVLVEGGVGPEVRVGVLLDRSPEYVVAMLAIWKAGGAAVPLDPDHPRDRLRYALEDCGATLVLTSEVHRAIVHESSARALLLDDEANFAADPLAPRAPAMESLAYCIYTSGTTGRPKGAMISHRALADAYLAWEQLYGLREIASHLQMASAGFDVSIGDLTRALGSGATLVFCPRERLLDPTALFELFARERIEFAEFVPAVLRGVAAYARKSGRRLESAKSIAIGSDVWTSAEIDAFRAAFGPRTRLANSYGVTEATIDSTCWFLEEGATIAAAPPIGSPLTHATVYVLDEQLEPTPPGVLGELYLGGPGVARGYHARPDLTADRFVPDPFGPPGARLYRTGDRARYLANGEVAFAGRGDDQVKIRGQRVELAEIEAALRASIEVASCAVVVKESSEGARLAAYLVPRTKGDFDPAALREAMRARLPEAWLPSAFVLLEALPLTPNGKVDRRRLPEPEWSFAAEYEPPRGAREAAVAAAFAEVLGRAQVGATDDFFALGGHSLLAVRVISALRAALGVELPLRALFETPVVRQLAARLDQAQGAPPPLVPAEAVARQRASFAQTRLWFLDRLEPGSPAYNLPTSLTLEGALDVAALEASLDALLARHEALRTTLVEGPEGPEQVIAPPARFALPVVDLRAKDAAARDREAARWARDEATRPFDLARGPLFRARLLRLATTRHTLLVTIHHAAADGWSFVVLVRELGELYGAALAGRALEGESSPLAPLAVQYADWAAWQRAWLEAGEMTRQLDYWRGELHGIETLVLPGDRPRPARPSYGGASIPVRLSARLRQKLETLARTERATLHMVLLAGFGAALGRWSGQESFAVGTPVANRRTREVEPLIGFFVNTLALRVRLGGARLSFRELLARVRESALGAEANQDVPFERVVEELAPERQLGHTPLFQVLFALQNVPVTSLPLPGLTLHYDEPETGVTRFDLELFLAESEAIETALGGRGAEAGLDGLLNYSTELFDRVTVERFVENLAALLDVATDAPDEPLDAFPPMAPSGVHLALRAWNAASLEYGDPLVVHPLFERWAREAPASMALRLGAETLTYGALNARSNQLARRLRARGVGPGHLLAIQIDRSFEMVTALLATMKAGAAYVPVDPEYPPERVALILEDSGADLTLDRRFFTEEADAIAREASDNLELTVAPDSLVYAVYTSGSTGRPKGVAMTHRAISNLLSFQRRDSARTSNDGDRADDRAPRTLQFASLSFDVSFQEIFSTLTAGGEVVLVTEEERRDASALLRIIDQTETARLFLPFVALNQLTEAASASGAFPRALREINTAGEQLKITPAMRAFFKRLPRCRLVNHYGPSETHLVTVFELSGPAAEWPALPSIGQPIANAPVYLLDARGRLVPIGTPGELYVGGLGLARGYYDRPELTAERFLPDPFAAQPGARMYRTGDLARFLANGDLEFLGRTDHQVKIRGYRVEPGEIEAALARHPAVRVAAVRAHEKEGGRRLAGYVVLHDEAAVSMEELRHFLGATLPEFMVPAAIVRVDALPLSPNGKVDRAALPEPEWSTIVARVAPRTKEEEAICAILAEVLELDAVGATDDFFDLGGHSLLATRVISRVRSAFRVEVPLRALFEDPTAEGIARAVLEAGGGVTHRQGDGAHDPESGVDSKAAKNAPRARVPRAEGDARRELSFAETRLWFLHRLDPTSAGYNLPAAVRLEGALDEAALSHTLQEITRRHEILRARYVEGPRGPERWIDPPSPIALPLEEASEVTLDSMLSVEATRPFDLARGPLLRLRLFRIAPRLHVLSVVFHHIAADGWSLGIFWRELAAGYRAARAQATSDARAAADGAWATDADRASDADAAAAHAVARHPIAEQAATPSTALPELAVQYADWAAWQRSWLAEGELDRQLAYWRSALEGAPPALELPLDRARPTEATWKGATEALSLDASLRRDLESLALREGVTLQMLLLAGYAWTLLQHAGQDEVVVGTPIANRGVTEAEPLIGFFVNTLPIRARGGEAGLTFRQLLARVREASLDAYANQDVPFERVVEELQPERARNRAPIFQTAFVLQKVELATVDLGGLTLRPFELESGTAKFDLMLILAEEGEILSGAFEYATELFDRSSIARFGASLVRTLRAAIAAPDRPLRELDLLDPDEARRLTHEWAAAPAASDARSFLARLAEQVAARPEAPALYGRRTADAPFATLTYRELDLEANRIAQHLAALGAGVDDRVAILLERSPRAIVALIAVMRAGAAYLPIDPADPSARVRTLLEEADARWLITGARGAESLRESLHESLQESRLEPSLESSPESSPANEADRVRVIDLDREAEAIAERSCESPRVTPHPDALAYVIFTSGSTGRPKGVGISHRALANYTAAAIERLELDGGLRFALVSTLAADLGHTAIFPALATGGCLFPVPPELVLDARGLADAFRAHPVDVMKIVPSHLFALLSGGLRSGPEILPRKRLILGGEATSGTRLRELPALAPECRIANHYGPTEATVGCVAGWPTDDDDTRTALPLGRPLAGTRAYVLDAAGRPAPIGVPGELWLGGLSVARGYLGRPDLTAERFWPDPFAADDGAIGARMYRTGDRARWLQDGRLEFLGRGDAQVKVRGFRVELREIEAALVAMREVAAAAVLAREDASGVKQLVAYVAPRVAHSPTLDGRKRRLLPSGLAPVELNRNETDYIHREIFELGAYLRHGISIEDGDTVVDVGGNIGLFSLFARQSARDVRLFVFEPNPHVAPITRANLSAYAPDARLFDFGLAESEREARFTFFPGFSLLSGLYADAETEREVVRSFLENQARAGVEGAAGLAAAGDQFLEERFRGEEVPVRLRTLSSVLREEGIDRVHLLKINVEKAELDVLRGIEERDWERIDQAVVEVDVAENREPILALFRAHDFELHVEQDPLLARTELCYVYAVRRGSGRALHVGAPPKPLARVLDDPVLTVEVLRERLARLLPAAMQPAAYVLLESLPVTANGKLDTRRLPAPETREANFTAPRGELESRVARIWAEVLQVEQVGAHDNFFDLGGHSLLLTRVHARITAEMATDLTVVELFQYPTVAGLAGRLGRSVSTIDATAAPAVEPSRERGASRRAALAERAHRRGREHQTEPDQRD